jgi:hypothetical protein
MPAWNQDSIRSSVISLLEKYEFIHNRLNQDADSDLEKSFIRLFSNPRIRVVSDITGDSLAGSISVQDYVYNLMEYYPEGVRVGLEMPSIHLGKPQLDRNDRYVLRARIYQTKTVLRQGQEYSHRSRIDFLVSFRRADQQNMDFTIAGIELAPVTLDLFGIEVCPSRSSFTNSLIDQDKRFDLKGDWSYRIGISFSHFFNSSWGLSIEPYVRTLTGSLTLDRFDAFGGFDPHLQNVVFSNRIWMAGCPVILEYRRSFGPKWSAYIGAGLSPEIRVFENQLVTAENTNSGSILTHVISEADWVAQMNRFNLGFTANSGCVYRVSPLIELKAGAAYFEGMTSLDHNERGNYETDKYSGQFNPLWGNSSKTSNRTLSVCLGLIFILNKEKR